jgi:hypothetical protein
MKTKIRVIKHGDQKPKELEPERQEEPSRQSAREITNTIKLWVSEFKERRRADEQSSRNANKLFLRTPGKLTVHLPVTL